MWANHSSWGLNWLQQAAPSATYEMKKKIKLKSRFINFQEIQKLKKERRKKEKKGRNHRNQSAKSIMQDVLQDKRSSFCYQIRGVKKGGGREGGRDCYGIKKV